LGIRAGPPNTYDNEEHSIGGARLYKR
jgi:hypothetical protein